MLKLNESFTRFKIYIFEHYGKLNKTQLGSIDVNRKQTWLQGLMQCDNVF